MTTSVYIDGFNLYYCALKHTPNKWLNPLRLCALLLPKNTISAVKYFTALVEARPHDPDQPVRQQIYIRALKTIPFLEVIEGHFLSHNKWMPFAYPVPGGPTGAIVIKTEEKGSDVNLATHLLNDGYKNRYEVAVVISNDSDLIEPICLVRSELNKPVIVLNPNPKKPSVELARPDVASFVKPIRQGVLAASQFPDVMTDANGTFHKPSTW